MQATKDSQLTLINNIPELCELRDLYLKDWPKHCIGYYCLDNFIVWLQKEPHLKNTFIYTLNGDWRSTGLHLIVHRYQLFVNSLYGSADPKIVVALSLLDWSKGFKVSSLPQSLRKVIITTVTAKQLEKEYDSLTLMYYLPKEQAIQLDIKCPEGFFLSDLGVESADEINQLWPHCHRGSLFLIKHLITFNINVGVYKRDTKELVAWCLRLQAGLLGALQVKDGYKRLGLGSLVAKATSRKIAQCGHDVIAAVIHDNMASSGMFEKLGFKIMDNVYWIGTSPTIAGYSWPADE